jgi:thiol-disulfide isomerase/thioredoxin
MKKQFLAALFILLSISTYGQQGSSRLNVKPAAPVAGKEVVVDYNASGGDLEFSDEVHARLAVFRNFQWEIVELPLKKVNGKWTGKYLLPSNAAFIALKFYQGKLEQPDVMDNNAGKGFYVAVLSSKGNLSQREKILTDVEFKAFAHQAMQEQLKDKNLSEQLLENIYQCYSFDLKDPENAKLVANRIRKNFPKGNTARFMAFHEATSKKGEGEYRKASEQFLKDFPLSEWRKKPDSRSFVYYTVYRGLASDYFDHKEYDQYVALFKEIDFKTANELYRWNILRGFLSGSVDKKILYGLSQKIIPYLLERKNDGSYLEDFGGVAVNAQKNADEQMDNQLYIHISLAKETGDYAGGKSYFKHLSDKGLYGNADVNEVHLYILEKLNDVDEIRPLLEVSVKHNSVTPLMFDQLKAIYKSNNNGSDLGYDKYLSSLKSQEETAALVEHVKSNMVNHPLIPFTLEDADGKMVSSGDWKDKIVVIDFWATWCRPCIMAFPGMQLLIDKYANDPKVAVYMIGTMQFGDYKTKSVNYVRSNGFRFHLLHDAMDENGEQQKVFRSLAPLFKSSGIPRKIIVKNGVVRYSSEGYSGSPSLLVDELSMAIEMLRAEN